MLATDQLDSPDDVVAAVAVRLQARIVNRPQLDSWIHSDQPSLMLAERLDACDHHQASTALAMDRTNHDRTRPAKPDA